MRDILGMMTKAKELQSKMQQAQEELGALEVSGTAGGGLVEVTLNGKGQMRRLRIDPSLMKPGESELLEDLVVAAHADARTKVDARTQEKMAAVTGGLGLPPGFKLPF